MPKAPKKNFKTDRVSMITNPALIKEFHDKTMTELHEGAWYDVLSKEYKPIYFTTPKNQKKLRNYIKRMKTIYSEKELNSFYNRFEQYEDMLSQNGREWGKETLKQWKRNKTQLGQSAGQIIGKRKQMKKIRNPDQILNVSIRKKKGVEADVEMKDPVKMVSPTKGKDPVGAVEEAKKYGNVPSGMDRVKSRAEKAKEKAKNLRGKKIDQKRNPDVDMLANAPTETLGQVGIKQAGKMTAETQRKGPHPAAQKLKKKKPSMTAATTVPKKVPYAKVSPAATAMTELQRAHDKQAQNAQNNKILTADTVRQQPHSKRQKAQESVDFIPKPEPKTSPFGQEPDTVYQQPKPTVNTAVQSEDYIPRPDPKTSPFGQEPDTVYQQPKPAAKPIHDPSMIGKLAPSHLYLKTTASTQTSIPGVVPDNNIQLQVQEAGIQTDPKKMHSVATQSEPYTMPLHPHYADRRRPVIGGGGGESKGGDDHMNIDTVGIQPGGGNPIGTPGGVEAESAEPPPPPPPGAPQPVQNAMGTQTGNTVDEEGNFIEINKGVPSSGGVSRGIGSGASYNVKNERNRLQKSAKKLLHEIKAFIELYG